jgi:hypothetical protein
MPEGVVQIAASRHVAWCACALLGIQRGSVATWELIDAAGQSLVRILQSHVDAVMPLAGVDVRLATSQIFESLAGVGTPTITLLLYRVLQHEELRNAPRRVLPDGTTTRPLLPLELCYLVTPWGVRPSNTPISDSLAAREEARLLGAILQCFYDHAEISRADLLEDPTRPVWETVDHAQLVLESLPVEDHYRIWDASSLAYRTSVTYRFRVIGLEPTVRDRSARVVEAELPVSPGVR